jgi:hypothetical protein
VLLRHRIGVYLPSRSTEVCSFRHSVSLGTLSDVVLVRSQLKICFATPLTESVYPSCYSCRAPPTDTLILIHNIIMNLHDTPSIHLHDSGSVNGPSLWGSSLLFLHQIDINGLDDLAAPTTTHSFNSRFLDREKYHYRHHLSTLVTRCTFYCILTLTSLRIS